MGVFSLIKHAHRPGTSLKQNAERIVPVDALTALARAPAAGVVLIQSRLGEDNLVQLHAVVKQVAMEIFAQHDWEIPWRQKYSRAKTLDFFVGQVWREYMGEPCRRCRGHGYVGRKLDMVRHHLDHCARCAGRGFIIERTAAYSIATRKPLLLRKPCPACRGKGLVEITEQLRAGKLRSCPGCWGSGSVPASLRARARALHDNHMNVKRFWLERFRIVLTTLRSIEREALIVCTEQLYGKPLTERR